ncbi:MAG: MotA/TolQ/ExbB proton channel family protein [Kiritimatiellae bacterium]|nr:MotA/TolQ/ExbB proton channel family protein [Kiritimatiellia bacterium]
MSFSSLLATAHPVFFSPEIWGSAVGLFRRGGPVMIPIACFSILGVCVAIDRIIAFAWYARANRRGRICIQDTLALLEKGDWENAEKTARSRNAPLCRILSAALENRTAGFADTLQMAAQRELNRLRRHVSLLDTTITVEPMLGILGTVTGIIHTFSKLNGAGIDNPQMATAGIGEALITTAAGLSVAILCLFPFNWIVSRQRRATEELEEFTHRAEIAFRKGGGNS